MNITYIAYGGNKSEFPPIFVTLKLQLSLIFVFSPSTITPKFQNPNQSIAQFQFYAMADHVTDLSPSGDAAATPPVRNVRRRLVQSTLFPLKPPLNKPEENDDSGDEQDEDYCDTKKNRRKRKSKGKITPLNKGSKVSDPLL